MGTRLGKQEGVPDVDLTGKTMVVTGANTGIGYEAAKTFAQLGATVIIACRSETKAKEAIERMKKENEEQKTMKEVSKVAIKADALKVEFMALDLGSLANTMSFVEAYKTRGLPLDVLVCNAGIVNGSNDPTVDGNEMQFQVNYLSHFLLILHLLPVIKATASGSDRRIVLVSSLAYRQAVWNEGDMQRWKISDGTDRYSNTKLYQIMQMFSLSERLQGSDVSVFSLHPGIVETEILSREGQRITRGTRILFGALRSMSLLRNPFQGALSTIHAAANPI